MCLKRYQRIVQPVIGESFELELDRGAVGLAREGGITLASRITSREIAPFTSDGAIGFWSLDSVFMH